MFVHSGAGLHGHEYSNRQQPTQAQRSLLRSSLRQSLTEENRRYSSPNSVSTRNTLQPDELASTHSANTYARRSLSESFKSKAHSVRFRDEGITPMQSEDEESIAGSECTVTTNTSTRRQKLRRAPRQSCQFALAQPAPRLRTKQRRLVQFRPRVLLQIQELGEKRAIPSFDVVPSSQVAGTFIIPLAARQFPRVFGAKPHLGQDDLLLVRSENYIDTPSPSSQESDSSGEHSEERDILAIITTAVTKTGDCTEIVLEDGAIWNIQGMANGSYELTKSDASGTVTTGRWVRKSTTPRRENSSSSDQADSFSVIPAENKWTFSIIDPSVKRHPIMGILTSTTLEVYDNYNTMSASSGRYPPSRHIGPDGIILEVEQPGSQRLRKEKRVTLPVSVENKALMFASAAWINLKQRNWPAIANPKYSRASSLHRQSYPEGQGKHQPLAAPNGRRSTSDARPVVPESRCISKCKDNSAPPSAISSPKRRSSAASAYMQKRRSDASIYDIEREKALEQQSGSEKSQRVAKNKLMSWLKACFREEESHQRKGFKS